MTKTRIEWADRIWNPVTGCTKVSQGCKHCYADREWESRFAHNPRQIAFGREFGDVQVHASRLAMPLSWTKPAKIFVNSMSDLFHDSVPFEFIAAVFGCMAISPRHVFQVLTKRPERMNAFFQWLDHEGGRRNGQVSLCVAKLLANGEDLPRKAAPLVTEAAAAAIPWPLPNVWLGVSVEDQTTADHRIPLLLQTPATVHWISAEPLLGPVGLATRQPPVSPTAKLDWVVVGGESGPRARPMHPDWARQLRDQCSEAGIAFNFKQWGEYIVPEDGAEACRVCGCTWNNACEGSCWWAAPGLCSTCVGKEPPQGDRAVKYRRVGRRNAGRLLDGHLWDEYPKETSA